MLPEVGTSLTAKHNATTILIVEDDEDTRTILVEALSTLTPYHVHAVTSSAAALHFATQIRPSLFILDYRLSQMNGLELYDQLHAIPEHENTPAIIISATSSRPLTSEIESRKLLRIEKPFDLDVFVAAIEQALGRSNQATS